MSGRASIKGWAKATGAGLLLVVLAACGSSRSQVVKTHSGKVFAVSAEKTSFFRYGPQQGNGPDEELPKDTLVTLIRPSFGYSKVQLVTGSQEGYVASEDIRPATPTLLAALNAPAAASVSSTSSLPENFDVQSSEPPPPEALPDPDLPPASVEPSPL